MVGSDESANLGEAEPAGDPPGRERALGQLIDALLDDHCRVVAVSGVGGIGKSTLVNAFSRRARRLGASVLRIDGSQIEPTSAGVLESLATAAGAEDPTIDRVCSRLELLGGRAVLVVENYDRLRLADGFIRDDLFPRLPATVLLVLVGRERLLRPWFSDPRRVGRTRSVELGAIDEVASMRWLTGLGLSEPAARLVFRVAAGHPLAMRMAADLISCGMDPGQQTSTSTAVVDGLATEYLRVVPDPETRVALEAACVLRRVTESSARAVLPDRAPSDVMDRLLELPFVDLVSDGLLIHDVVRHAIVTHLSIVAPERHQQYRRAAWLQVRAEMRGAPRSSLWRHTADLLHLLDAPELREAFFPTGLQPLIVAPARTRDRGAIDSIIAAHCRPEEASALRAWWANAPHTFAVCADEHGEVVGLRVVARRDDLGPALVAADAVAARWLDDVQRLPAGAEVLMFRRLLDRDEGEANSASRASFGLDLKRTYMEMRPRLRYLYNLGADPSEMQWAPMLGFDRRDDLAVELDEKWFHTWRLDMGPESVDGWLARLAAKAIGIEPSDGDVFDRVNHRVSLSDGRLVDLTPLEHSVMTALWRRQGRPVSRADLLAEVWGCSSDATSNVVDTLIAGLRRKLGPDRHQIETVRGVGYRCRAEPRASVSA